MTEQTTSNGRRTGERGIAALLRRMHDVVATEATAQQRLDDLTRVIASHVEADVCSIYLRLPNDELELFSSLGLNRDAVHKTRLSWGEGLVGRACATQRPLVTADAPLHPAFSYRPETGEDALHGFLGVPLLRSGKALGVLVLQNRQSRRYSDEEIEAAQAVATLLAEIAASGELLDEPTTRGLDAVLTRPERFVGLGVVPGVAIGQVAFHEAPLPKKHNVLARDVDAEAARLDSALKEMRASVDAMLARPGLGAAPREVLEAYRLFAYDGGWKERMRKAVHTGLTAESAVEQVQMENRTRIGNARDPYLRERLHDLDDLSYRLLRHLTGAPAKHESLPDAAVVVARTMGPADLLEYDRARIVGLVLAEASATSHVAIVARALDVPLVAGLADLVDGAEAGDDIVVDGDLGEAHLRPRPDVVASYREKRELRSERQAAYAREKALPFETADGVEIDAQMNAGLAIDMAHLDATGATGVGLFRTELQFLIGAQLPGVSAQTSLYSEILDLADGKPVVFRTADLGGDKSADYMKRPGEANPAMGWRGLRIAVDRPGLLRQQLRALLSAAAGRDLYVLFPMVTLASEIAAARQSLDKEIDVRRKRAQPLPTSIAVGAMIETPSAAWGIEAVAAHADFLSVGGNDLAQFYFAADRDSDRTQRRYDPLDPGFLTFLRRTFSVASDAGKPLSYCGEQATDPVVAAALMAVGARRFSIPATSVGGFRRLVRSLPLEETSAWLHERLQGSSDSVRRDLAIFLRARGASVEL